MEKCVEGKECEEKKSWSKLGCSKRNLSLIIN